MYAVIDIGGKQYKAAIGDVLTVEKLAGSIGDKIDLKVVFKSTEGAIDTTSSTAQAEIVGHGKGKKIVVFKYKAKKNIRKKQGHRQQFSKVKILSI